MATKEKATQLLGQLFRSLVEESNPKRLTSRMHDLFVRIDLERGEVVLLGDDEEPLASCVIFSWIVPEEEAPTEEMIVVLREVVATLERQNYWEHPLFEQPFSVVLVDKMFAPIENLLYLDEDMIQVTRPLLEGLSEELDDFIHNLLGDLK